MGYNPAKPYKRQILGAIEETWNTPHIQVRRGVYPAFRKKFSGWEVDHTDGIGTKGYYHWRLGTFREAVIDALAMNLNDLALVRATPYKLSNHITVPVEDERVYRVVREVVRECSKREIAVVGGENSFHNTAEGLDISMTISGLLHGKPTPNAFHIGDTLVGLKSSGLHSNGFTTVRRVFGKIVRKEFTRPTAVYLNTILALDKRFNIHGMMHITGGAFTKLKDVLGARADAHIAHPRALTPHPIFYELRERGKFSNKVMYSTFNCGIGFILSVPPRDAERIVHCTRGAAIIGSVKNGGGKVHVLSAFSNKTTVL
ncbi:hypothetical protein A2673_02120 [Candidatus Kaiserbacteria bacterium RIFCSPHIGHO2_01_FULL_50_13]|uniref:Phosphoribosylformylglycinamidine cyclo-ligase n=1 Tax=Candidatus Kaiserbacteria bacterium RIFCSPLOWO2_01_FULL_50_24 TaxID=1798507 RepID=A0A1F6ER85_9BACT|nr:MAG: hypothetical protein A2673_02120 [Candidatus Kaiserbacteria bacterium RIFCSPHIGHO2_01_FULL_50_13]OGG76119.1 MAG: hypothetical protein A3A34_00850 [Candidatus Kaiserbacteria bacterium RIFCSPLOWO2_01_FULL_50_24]OGG82350.1 MAG: hypothetical protein A3H74_00070 [Candidatus Kaiserbacteria bacterium RIFCSPLOWO2_02_FULL_51_13]